MKKVEKFLKHISKLETGSAPSVEYFEQIILEAREALEEFEQFRQYNIIVRSEQLPCEMCGGKIDKEDKFTDEKKCENCGWF